MMDKNEEFMEEALKIAESNMHHLTGGPFGALIVKNGTIIAKAANTVTRVNDPTAHAEINAIRLAAESLGTFNLNGCELYTSCEPCPMCLAAVYWARIDKIYFSGNRLDAKNAGFDDSFIYDEFDRPVKNRKVKIKQLLPKEGKTVLEQWAMITDRVDY